MIRLKLTNPRKCGLRLRHPSFNPQGVSPELLVALDREIWAILLLRKHK